VDPDTLVGALRTTQVGGFGAKARQQTPNSQVHPLLLPLLHAQAGSLQDAAVFGSASPNYRRTIRDHGFRSSSTLQPRMHWAQQQHQLQQQQQRQFRMGSVGSEALYPACEESSTPLTSPQGWLAHSPAILVPSAALSNDMSRVRNAGEPLLRRLQRGNFEGFEAGGLLHVASQPLLDGRSGSSRTPRQARSLVRKVSKVGLHYPDIETRAQSPMNRSLVDEGMLEDPVCPTEGSTHTWEGTGRSPIIRTLPKSRRRASESAFWPSTFVVRKEDQPSHEQLRSAALRDVLKDLRRMKRDPPPHNDAGGAQPAEAGELAAPEVDGAPREPPPAYLDTKVSSAEALGLGAGGGDADVPPDSSGPMKGADGSDDGPIYALLKDLNDTSEGIDDFVELLTDGTNAASKFGGSRRATTVISMRTLLVARRKRQLCSDVEDHIAEFEAAHAKRDALLPLIIADTAEPPEALRGAKQFVQRYTHRPTDPVDADKSDFGAFVSSFKLPRKHQHLERMRALMLEVGEWWAEACVTQAIAGQHHAVLKRLFNVALGSGIDESHPKLVHAMQILTDRLADRVLNAAKDRKERDDAMQESQPLPPVGPASNMADKIEEDIRSAIKEGVKPKDPRLDAAQQIAKELRQQDGQRKRLHNRQKQQEEKKKKEAANPAVLAFWDFVNDRFPSLDAAYKKFDDNNSGSISFIEFTTGVASLGFDGDPKFIWRCLDSDSSGALSKKEFMASADRSKAAKR